MAGDNSTTGNAHHSTPEITNMASATTSTAPAPTNGTTALAMLAAHVNMEHRASRLYQQLSAWAERASWPGTAQHFRRHAAEEFQHSQQYIDYVVSRESAGGIPVILGTQFAFTEADMPAVSGNGLMDAFGRQLAMDREILTDLNAIAEQARKDRDEDTVRFVHTHTGGNVVGIDGDLKRVDWLRRAVDSGDIAALFTFDRMVGQGHL